MSEKYLRHTGRRLRAGRNVEILTEDDVADIFAEFEWAGPLEPAQLYRALSDDKAQLIYAGRQWGWDDSVVRDELAELLGVEF